MGVAHAGQNCTVRLSRSWLIVASHLVGCRPRSKGVGSQGILAPLNDSEVLWGCIDPKHALLRADAAVALAGGFELGHVNFVDESCAVAVTAVRLEGGVGHRVFV